MLAGIAQQQRSGVDELGGRRLSAVRECFQTAAFFFGKGNLISGCHAPIIHQQKSAVNMRTVTCYIVLVFWSVVDGLVDTQKGTNNSANDPLEALIAIRDLKEKTLILLRDFHLFLQDPNPILIRQLKDVLQMAKTKSKTLIILGCRMVLPPELERELTVIEFALPGKEELGAVLGGIMESANIKNMENEQREKVIDAASGLTTIEAENAFALGDQLGEEHVAAAAALVDGASEKAGGQPGLADARTA